MKTGREAKNEAKGGRIEEHDEAISPHVEEGAWDLLETRDTGRSKPRPNDSESQTDSINAVQAVYKIDRTEYISVKTTSNK